MFKLNGLTGFTISRNAATAKRLLCGIGTSSIGESSIEITDYPFEPSVVYPSASIAAHEIDAISLEFGVCKVYVKDDIVFVSAEKKKELAHFTKVHNLKLIPYSWNWDWLLEPYLDTEFTKENEQRVLERLLENGFTTTEIDAIRAEVKKQMYAYNFDTMLWDWCSLSLSDVLSAIRAKYNKVQFRDFYSRALEIEKRSPTNT
ncbi:hypothetical protein VBZ51_09530 [Maribacter sp. HS]|uniref:hypothetical protein n=1 Tax=Maribacter sp. HS TaxID=3110480 RepID=UPI003A889618